MDFLLSFVYNLTIHSDPYSEGDIPSMIFIWVGIFRHAPPSLLSQTLSGKVAMSLINRSRSDSAPKKKTVSDFYWLKPTLPDWPQGWWEILMDEFFWNAVFELFKLWKADAQHMMFHVQFCEQLSRSCSDDQCFRCFVSGSSAKTFASYVKYSNIVLIWHKHFVKHFILVL